MGKALDKEGSERKGSEQGATFSQDRKQWQRIAFGFNSTSDMLRCYSDTQKKMPGRLLIFALKFRVQSLIRYASCGSSSHPSCD